MKFYQQAAVVFFFVFVFFSARDDVDRFTVVYFYVACALLLKSSFLKSFTSIRDKNDNEGKKKKKTWGKNVETF